MDRKIVQTSIEQAPKVNILGVGISAIKPDIALQQIDAWIENKDRQYVAVCTVNTIMECQKDDTMLKAINNAGMATPDGMPLVWLANRNSDHQVERVYGPDLMLAVCESSVERGYRHFLYGGAAGVPELLSKELQSRFPGLEIVGEYSPPFRDLTLEEEELIINMINQANPDVIWVGLGTPKQDLWMAKHRSSLSAPVIIAVGAAFDFHTKRIAQAPEWMQRSGLEWLFRFSQEPSRLWHRYLVYNPLFILRVIEQRLGLKRYNLETNPTPDPQP
jgi:N-acetylglucosaminyldiphosphoundecaprenol N-acetyl-beta-D-mannosaminyltransferase